MMYISTPLKHKAILPVLALFGMLFTSCGTFQQSSYYDKDGIYDSDSRVVGSEQSGQSAETNPNTSYNTDTYSQYFGQTAKQYEDLLESGAVFTDIDSYSSHSVQDSIDIIDDNEYLGGQYGAWGDQPSSVAVNVYNTSPYWGWYSYPWSWRWRWNYGWGYNNYWWPGWTNRWYDPYWCYTPFNSYWGGYYGGWSSYYGGYPYYYGGRPYYYNRHYSPYYGRRSYAYAGSRRGYYSGTRVASVNSRARYADRTRTSRTGNVRDRYARYNKTKGYTSSTNRRYRNSSGVSVDRSQRTRTYSGSQSRDYGRQSNPSNRTYRGNTSTRRSSGYSKPSTSTRSRGTSVRRPSSSSRPSGSMRSSRSSSRSSGISRSSRSTSSSRSSRGRH